MTHQHAGMAGTAAAYDNCPGCGHARVKHTRPGATGCTYTGWFPEPDTPVPPSERYGLCSCTLGNDFATRKDD